MRETGINFIYLDDGSTMSPLAPKYAIDWHLIFSFSANAESGCQPIAQYAITILFSYMMSAHKSSGMKAGRARSWKTH